MKFPLLLGAIVALAILAGLPKLLADEEAIVAEEITTSCRFVQQDGQRFDWEPRDDGWCYGADARRAGQ